MRPPGEYDANKKRRPTVTTDDLEVGVLWFDVVDHVDLVDWVALGGILVAKMEPHHDITGEKRQCSWYFATCIYTSERSQLHLCLFLFSSHLWISYMICDITCRNRSICKPLSICYKVEVFAIRFYVRSFLVSSTWESILLNGYECYWEMEYISFKCLNV